MGISTLRSSNIFIPPSKGELAHLFLMHGLLRRKGIEKAPVSILLSRISESGWGWGLIIVIMKFFTGTFNHKRFLETSYKIRLETLWIPFQRMQTKGWIEKPFQVRQVSTQRLPQGFHLQWISLHRKQTSISQASPGKFRIGWAARRPLSMT